MSLYDKEKKILNKFKNWLEVKSSEGVFSDSFFDEIDKFLDELFESHN